MLQNPASIGSSLTRFSNRALDSHVVTSIFLVLFLAATEREKTRLTANGEICNNSAARCIQQGAIIDPAQAAWSGRIKLFIRHPFGVSLKLTLLWKHTSTHRSDWYCNTATRWRAGRAATADLWRWACLSNPLKRCRAQSKRFATNCCWVCITPRYLDLLKGLRSKQPTQEFW